MSPAQANLIRTTIEAFPLQTEISLAFIKNQEVSYHGVRRDEHSMVATTSNTSFFEIGSISKLFTTTILANVALNKGIDLETNIQDFLSIPIHNGEQISLVSLANHTSGLPEEPPSIIFDENSENPFAHFDQASLENYLQNELKVDATLKGSFNYSNIGFAILGYVLTQIENMSFPALLEKYVLGKYNMDLTTFDRNRLADRIVQGLDSKGKPVNFWQEGAFSGGLLSTVAELSKFVLAQFDDSDTALELTRDSTYSRDKELAIGLGWAIRKSKRGKSIHFHPGATRGYRSFLVVDVEQKSGIVILSNISAFHSNANLINDLGFDLISTIQQ